MSDEPIEQNESGGGDVCRPTSDETPLVDRQSQLVYEPFAREIRRNRVEIRAGRENPDVIPWGFWGGVLAAAVAGWVLLSGALAGPAVRFSVWNVLIAAGLGLLGLVLYRLGRTSTLDEVLLCELQLDTGIISWPADDGEVPVAVAFDDVQTLTFAIEKVPVAKSRSGTRLDAATVRIEDDRGRVLPVVPASTSKGETHRVARMLGELWGMDVDYVGTGVSEWADRKPLLP